MDKLLITKKRRIYIFLTILRLKKRHLNLTFSIINLSTFYRDIAELPHETEDEVGFFNNRGDGIRREDQGLMQEDEVLNLHYSNVYANQGERPPTLGDEPPPAERKRLEAEEQYI